MNTKDKVLELFENNKGVYFSGEEIAKKLEISRAAIWKAVNALRSEGYSIDAVPNKGYALATDTDRLSVQGIEKYLDEMCKSLDVRVFAEQESTNTTVRQLAADGAKEGTVVIAGRQTGGRGRRGRSFYSPQDTGIYMSILLRPSFISAKEALSITTMAAVAISEAIEAVSCEEAKIKWVNDIFMRGRKVCGILTEAAFGLEADSLEYAVLGLGINVNEPEGGFPDEIKDIAGAVFKEPVSDAKNRLAAEVINRFMAYYHSRDLVGYISEYRRRSFVIGKDVLVMAQDGPKPARALDVDEECRLIVQYPDGTKEALHSGEISIKLG